MPFNFKKLGLFLFVLFLGMRVQPAFDCQYNVRETGFVDLESRPYLLYLFVNNQIEENVIINYKNILRDVLNESNINSEIVDHEKNPEHPAKQIYLKSGATSFPVFVLVSPDGQILNVPVIDLKEDLRQIVSSPQTNKIKSAAIKNYAVVLLIDGTDQTENDRAYKIAQSAVEQIGKKMDMLPKPIKFPPTMVRMEQKSFAEEKVLLWSLGLNAGNISVPHAAVVYGKARWIGPLLTGDHFTKNNLVDLLLVIGADCECGLDKEWLQGTMLPVKWDMPVQKQVANNLGFDAESPYIKMEMMAIMRNSMLFNSPTLERHAVPDSSPMLSPPQPNPIANADFPNPSKVLNTNSNTLLKNSFVWVLLFLLLIVAIGSALLFNKRRYNQNI